MISLLCIVLIGYIEEPWRWTHFGDFREVNSISVGIRYVYIGGKGGLMRFDKLKGGWLVPRTRKAFPNINLVAQDFGGNEVWFTTSSALGRYNPVFEDYRISDFPAGYSAPCSLGMSENYIYLWNSYQCIRFDKFREEWESIDSLPSEVEWFPNISPSQYPWLAPYYIMDRHLNQYEMTCAARDGNWLWIGTRGMGIYKYNAMTYIPEHYVLGFSGEGQLAMLRDGKYIWIGTGQEIVRWDLNQGSSSYYLMTGEHSLLGSNLPELLSGDIVSLVNDGNRIWFGSAYGLFQFDKQAERYERFSSDRITALAVEDRKLWIGTQDGLFRMEQGIKEEIFENVWVNDIKVRTRQSLQEIWVATSRGIMRRVGGEWKNFDDQDKILAHGVYRILFDEHHIYFGSTRQGLLVYQELTSDTHKWDRFTSPVYLAGERILSIAVDSMRVYIGTDKGVSVWEKRRNLWKKYTENNSPIKGGVYSIFLDNGDAYFGTDSGIVKLGK